MSSMTEVLEPEQAIELTYESTATSLSFTRGCWYKSVLLELGIFSAEE